MHIAANWYEPHQIEVHKVNAVQESPVEAWQRCTSHIQVLRDNLWHKRISVCELLTSMATIIVAANNDRPQSVITSSSMYHQKEETTILGVL
eukprot:8117-Heterococcus_DN1.PRE.6